jgi:hypothetical protein
MRLRFFSPAKSDTHHDQSVPARELDRVRGWMRLTTDHVRDEFNPAAGALAMALGEDRRSVARQDMSDSGVVASIRAITAGSFGQHFAGRLRDISHEGLSLLVAEPIEPGEAFSIAVAPVNEQADHNDQPVFLRCTSIWCRPERKNGAFAVGFAIGVEFSDSIADLVTPRGPSRPRRAA